MKTGFFKNWGAISAFAAVSTLGAAANLSAEVITIDKDAGQMSFSDADIVYIQDGGKLGSNSIANDATTINIERRHHRHKLHTRKQCQAQHA